MPRVFDGIDAFHKSGSWQVRAGRFQTSLPMHQLLVSASTTVSPAKHLFFEAFEQYEHIAWRNHRTLLNRKAIQLHNDHQTQRSFLPCSSWICFICSSTHGNFCSRYLCKAWNFQWRVTSASKKRIPSAKLDMFYFFESLSSFLIRGIAVCSVLCWINRCGFMGPH